MVSKLMIWLVILIPFFTIQSQDSPVITPENVDNLAVFRRISPGDFGFPDAEIMQFAFAPGNPQLVVAMQGELYRRNALIGLYDVEQNEAIVLIEDQTFRSTGYRTTGLYFSTDANLLVSTGSSGFIVWDIIQHEYLFGGSPAGTPIITPDNHYMIILTGNVAHIWDIQQQREVDRRQFSCVSPIVIDGQRVECFQRMESTFLVEVYDLPSFDLIDTYEVENPRPGHSGNSSVVTSNSGDLVADLDQERHIILRSSITGDHLLTISQPGQNAYQWYEYRFYLEDRYFGVLGMSSSILELYAVADCYATTDREINLRTGPGTEFDNPTIMQPGERLTIVEQLQQGNHLWMRLGIDLWVREDVIEMQGDC